MASQELGKEPAKDDICSICLEALKNPLQLPCNHFFCSECIEGWRSKYSSESIRGCPQCRSIIPPPAEILGRLQAVKHAVEISQKELTNMNRGALLPLPKLPSDPDYDDTHADDGMDALFMMPEGLIRTLRDSDIATQQQGIRLYLEAVVQHQQGEAERMEREIAQSGNQLLTDTDDVDDLPDQLRRIAAGYEGNTQMILDWLGPKPIPSRRINAKNRQHLDRTLLHEAQYENRVGLLALLLQLGANVDPKSTFGQTPFEQALRYKHLDPSARLLLQWGAAIKAEKVENMDGRNKALKDLLQLPLGGRRVEFHGLKSREDLNGRTGVARKYNQNQARYVVKLELTEEEVLVRPVNLKRRDRTPADYGIHYTYGGVQPEGRGEIFPWFPSTEMAEQAMKLRQRS